MKKLMLMSALFLSSVGVQASELNSLLPYMVIFNAGMIAMAPMAAVKVDQWLAGSNPDNSVDTVCRGLVATGSAAAAIGIFFANSKNFEFAKSSKTVAELGALVTFTTMIGHATVRTILPAAQANDNRRAA